MKGTDEDGKGEGRFSATLGAAAGGPGLSMGAFAPSAWCPQPCRAQWAALCWGSAGLRGLQGCRERAGATSAFELGFDQLKVVLPVVLLLLPSFILVLRGPPGWFLHPPKPVWELQ